MRDQIASLLRAVQANDWACLQAAFDGNPCMPTPFLFGASVTRGGTDILHMMFSCVQCLYVALIDATDSGGASLLALAVRYGHDEMVGRLADAGADVEVCL